MTEAISTHKKNSGSSDVVKTLSLWLMAYDGTVKVKTNQWLIGI